ncbi:MAG TPA: AgmX/PglI C-terminal domain-containing protein [Kofleriaceae bacterium]|nr:AgmX/PglI C-terminal domain-containing protein [Kofleriaceae bacterium]
MSPRVTFRIFRGTQLLREQTLTQSVIKIGKLPSAHLYLDDESVSRMHAIVEIDRAGVIHLIDLGSSRGTFVNGQRINKARLESGDMIALGELRIELVVTPDVADVRIPAVQHPAVQHPAVPSPAVQDPAVSVQPPALPPAIVRPPASPAPIVPLPAVRETVVRPPAVRAPAVPIPAVLHPAVRYPAGAAIVPDGAEEPGAEAVEVAAMLGDSVVGVKHCMDPRSGTIKPKTWALLGGALACLVASLASFAISVSTAASNKAALEAWTHAHKPPGAFRPEMLSPAYDLVAFGGLALALAGIALALVRMRDERRSPYYRVGTAPGVEQPLDTAPAPSFPLVAPAGDDFVFNYGAGIDGELAENGTTTTFAELAASGRARPSPSVPGAYQLAISPRARIVARSGQTTFSVRAVPRPRRHAAPLFAGLDSRIMTYVGGSLAAHLTIWLVLQQIPEDAGAANVDITSMEADGIHAHVIDHDDTTQPPPEQDSTGSGGNDMAMSSAMPLDEGQSGRPTATTTGRFAMKQRDEDPQVARERAIEEARASGVMGDMPALTQAITSMTATADFDSGFDTTDAWGSVYGAEAGESRGTFGFGLKGYERGGGCLGGDCGIIGTGRYATIPGGRGPGDGAYGIGGFPHMRHYAPVPPPVKICASSTTRCSVSSGLDKEIIRRYIKRNLDKIRYCYEKELIARPDLAGEVAVNFFISPLGNVQSSKGSGFDPVVSSCVADVISRIEFPKPQNDSGGVEVNYPFEFNRAGR